MSAERPLAAARRWSLTLAAGAIGLALSTAAVLFLPGGRSSFPTGWRAASMRTVHR